jgi:outer membrane protein assembly factor BamB
MTHQQGTMLSKTIAVLALAASLGAIGIPPSLAGAKSTTGTGGWTNTDSNAAHSRANLSENVLTPTAVTKVKYLRSLASPPPRSASECGGGYRYVAAPLPFGGRLYAITSERLSKYNPATGSLIWRKKLSPYFIAKSLSITSGLVIVGSIGCRFETSEPGGSIEAFNASTGASVWRVTYAPSGLNQAVTVGTSYVVAEGADAAGSDATVLNVKDGTPIWSNFGCLNGSYPNDPVVVGLMVMGYGNCDSQGDPTIEARHIATGALAWSLPFGWVIQRGDLAGSAGSHLYVTDPSGTVEALNPQTGQVEYPLNQAVTVLAVDATRVYATCGSTTFNTNICAYSISTGGLVWQTNLFTSSISVNIAAEADGVLYLGSGQALKASTGQVIKKVWGLNTYNSSPSAIAVGDGRIAVVGDLRVLDLYGLPGS